MMKDLLKMQAVLETMKKSLSKQYLPVKAFI